MRAIGWMLLALLFAWRPAHADEALWSKLKTGGYVLLIRHAATDPGVGDPPGFKLDDCKTQRNLNAAGRRQATKLGAEFRKRGIPVSSVLSSRWCRCIETSKLVFGKAESWPPLDNTFDTPERREPQMREVRKRLAQPVTGGNLALVTHGVNVLALTGASPGEAEVIVVQPGPQPQVVGRLSAGG